MTDLNALQMTARLADIPDVDELPPAVLSAGEDVADGIEQSLATTGQVITVPIIVAVLAGGHAEAGLRALRDHLSVVETARLFGMEPPPRPDNAADIDSILLVAAGVLAKRCMEGRYPLPEQDTA